MTHETVAEPGAGARDAEPSDARVTPRVHLAWFLVPMALVFASAQVGAAIWPSLLDSAPVDAAPPQQQLDPPADRAAARARVGVLRARLRPDHAARAAVLRLRSRVRRRRARWSERKLGTSGRHVVTVERYFRRFGLLIVAVWWSVFICLLAGATGMRARIFFPVLLAGTIARVTLIYFVGDALSDPITEIAHFISRYALIITPITIALTALQLWYGRRRDRGLSLDDLEDLEGGFEETEAEVGGEATVDVPPEPD